MIISIHAKVHSKKQITLYNFFFQTKNRREIAPQIAFYQKAIAILLFPLNRDRRQEDLGSALL